MRANSVLVAVHLPHPIRRRTLEPEQRSDPVDLDLGSTFDLDIRGQARVCIEYNFSLIEVVAFSDFLCVVHLLVSQGVQEARRPVKVIHDNFDFVQKRFANFCFNRHGRAKPFVADSQNSHLARPGPVPVNPEQVGPPALRFEQSETATDLAFVDLKNAFSISILAGCTSCAGVAGGRGRLRERHRG